MTSEDDAGLHEDRNNVSPGLGQSQIRFHMGARTQNCLESETSVKLQTKKDDDIMQADDRRLARSNSNCSTKYNPKK